MAAKLTDEAREARNAYQREWRRKHKAKIDEYARKHWEKVAMEQKGKAEP